MGDNDTSSISSSEVLNYEDSTSESYGNSCIKTSINGVVNVEKDFEVTSTNLLEKLPIVKQFFGRKSTSVTSSKKISKYCTSDTVINHISSATMLNSMPVKDNEQNRIPNKIINIKDNAKTDLSVFDKISDRLGDLFRRKKTKTGSKNITSLSGKDLAYQQLILKIMSDKNNFTVNDDILSDGFCVREFPSSSMPYCYGASQLVQSMDDSSESSQQVNNNVCNSIDNSFVRNMSSASCDSTFSLDDHGTETSFESPLIIENLPCTAKQSDEDWAIAASDAIKSLEARLILNGTPCEELNSSHTLFPGVWENRKRTSSTTSSDSHDLPISDTDEFFDSVFSDCPLTTTVENVNSNNGNSKLTEDCSNFGKYNHARDKLEQCTNNCVNGVYNEITKNCAIKVVIHNDDKIREIEFDTPSCINELSSRSTSVVMSSDPVDKKCHDTIWSEPAENLSLNGQKKTVICKRSSHSIIKETSANGVSSQVIENSMHTAQVGDEPLSKTQCFSTNGLSENLLKRYYHVFREGELAQLIVNDVPYLRIIDCFYDHANWCVIAEKMQYD